MGFTKKEKHEDHMENRFAAWLSWFNYDDDDTQKNNYRFIGCDEPSVKSMEKMAKKLWNDICNCQYQIIKDVYIFKDEDIKKFYKDGNNEKEREKIVTDNRCAYCATTAEDLEEFKDIIRSATWQRGGKKWELDRKHCYMATYLEEDKIESFIQTMRGFLDNFFQEFDGETNFEKQTKTAWENIDEDKKKKLLLSMPAPYNSKNCAWICYYCNNAKSDFFTDKEFEPVAAGIGKAIKKILRIHNEKFSKK
jgi:hypothetical protein